MSWVLYLAIAVVGYLILQRRRQEKELNEPPVVPYLVPFIGSMISFGMNPLEFLEKNRKQVRLIFSLCVHYLITTA
jgi:sterol 14-demethylase